ncbi:MAG: anthranilate phosphoribosyltransferase [Alphaproteobacteria bacterium]|nr:anthranilate phosphoribosyltransferase [Alphaproteobacteria bacterium]MCB9794394.1 anthranilate phosphoribosyltransferase [Alphaproteobacteria bacterium]
MTLAPVLERLLAGEDLEAARVDEVMEAMLAGELDPVAIGGFLVALRAKGETVEEIAAAARVMRRHATAIPVPEGVPLVDTCGTGGDRSGTFNLSTAAAIVAAAAGATVAKHGNRSVSSKAGSADVLEALGVRLDLPPARLGEVLQEVGISFLFAPAHHAATRHAVGPRRALGVRTLFNVLGPLTNPAGATRQVMGVFSEALIQPLAEVLAALGAERALVVHGHGGLDELSIAGPSAVCRLLDGVVTPIRVTPEEVGLERAPLSTLQGGTAEENAAILSAIFDGERSARADAVAFNAGAALWAAGLAEDLAAGTALALETLAAGGARVTLDKLVEATNR